MFKLDIFVKSSLNYSYKMNHKLINKVTFSFLFFISSWQYASCQKDFLNGYIINLNGDTVNGFIKYKNTVNNPNEVTFINKLSKEQQTFSPKEIKAYSVKDEFFESANVSTEVGQSDTKEINFDTSLKLTRINVFLQTIIHGNKSLYYYHGKHQNEHFYIKKDSVFELLIYKKYYSKIDDITTEKENKKYINQLYNYLEDCSTIVTKLNNTEYYKSDLEKLFIYYYNEMKTVLTHIAGHFPRFVKYMCLFVNIS